MKILFAWIGMTDMRASQGSETDGLGPIGQVVAARRYDRIALLTNLEEKQNKSYQKWLSSQTEAPIDVRRAKLSSPTEFGEIYKKVAETISAVRKEFSDDLAMTFHLSPGTPAMAAVWIIAAKTIFSAELIESSKQAGVRTVSVPFEISAEFVPDMIRQADHELEKVSTDLNFAGEFSDIIFKSPQMREVVDQAQTIAPHNMPVLIDGESGTGKELFARAIHRAGQRSDKPFVTVNCGAISPELVESELFGHTKGAFTGADRKRAGYFTEADGGTIFLDEIGELPPRAQVKLLRVLQEKEVTPVGSAKPEKIDVRVISATNKNLIEEIAKGNFREDLFYRLAVFPLHLPPLRSREGDLSLLTTYFLDKLNGQNTGKFWKEDKRFSPGAKNLLINHFWIGNIRELQNTIFRIAILSKNTVVSEDDVKRHLISGSRTQDTILDRSFTGGFDIKKILAEVIDHYLERALTESNQNKTKAAELVGLPNYQTFDNWLNKYR